MLGQRPNSAATDRALQALCHRCRRRLLFELYEGDGEPVNYVAVVSFRTEAQRAQLSHNHLPMLEALGYVEWNEPEETIQKGKRWGEIEPLLELLDTHLCDLPPFLQGRAPDSGETKS